MDQPEWIVWVGIGGVSFGVGIIVFAALWLKPGDKQEIKIPKLGVDLNVSYPIVFVLSGILFGGGGGYMLYIAHETEVSRQSASAGTPAVDCNYAVNGRFGLVSLSDDYSKARKKLDKNKVKVLLRRENQTKSTIYANSVVESGPGGTTVEIKNLGAGDVFQIEMRDGNEVWRSDPLTPSTGFIVLSKE